MELTHRIPQEIWLEGMIKDNMTLNSELFLLYRPRLYLLTSILCLFLILRCVSSQDVHQIYMQINWAGTVLSHLHMLRYMPRHTQILVIHRIEAQVQDVPICKKYSLLG